MAKAPISEIVTQQHKRIFLQHGGPRATNPVRYAGVDTQYLNITGLTRPISGGIDPIRVPNPRRLGSYRIVGRSRSAPDFPTATLEVLEKHGGIPFQLGDLSCPFNIYIPTGLCRDLSDFSRGWSDYVEILELAEATDFDGGDRTSWDADEQVADSLDLTLNAHYVVGALGFGEKAPTAIDREVADLVYGSGVSCGSCGPQDNGTKRIYAVTKSSGSGSPGLPAEVVYTLDSGATWVETSITGIGATEDPSAIRVIGDKLVVFTRTAGSATLSGYYWATLGATGAPGTWTKVTSGFVSSKQLNDVYVAGPREVYIAADGGYVYRSTDITTGVEVLSAGAATTSALYRIRASEDTIVAVGASSTIIKSINRGATFATTTASVAGTPLDLTAVDVLDGYRFWVGASNSGRLYYTVDGGESWAEKSFSGAGSGGGLPDVTFVTESVGYFLHNTAAGVARLFSTWNGGADWTMESPRIQNMPTFQRANRLAVPMEADPTIAANYIALGGLASGGTDGILVQGAGSIQ